MNWGAWASATAGARMIAAAVMSRRILFSLWEERRRFLVISRWSSAQLPSVVPTAVCRLPSAVCRLPSAVCRLLDLEPGAGPPDVRDERHRAIALVRGHVGVVHEKRPAAHVGARHEPPITAV